MKERPILFSGPMVRAILEGRKTVTRRALTARAIRDVGYGAELGECHELPAEGPIDANSMSYIVDFCPYGKVGERLWVRESFADLRGTGIEHRPDPAGPLHRYAFAADSPPGSASDEARKDFGVRWKPSIHMPRAACRIVLEITDVRVERLQDISGDQAEAEGVDSAMCRQFFETSPSRHECKEAVIHGFAGLWASINGPEAWHANPWVWVVEFRRVAA